MLHISLVCVFDGEVRY